jgi:hypothetical protein
MEDNEKDTTVDKEVGFEEMVRNLFNNIERRTIAQT